MTGPSIDKQCPYCGEWTPAAMDRCQACGELEHRSAPPAPADRPVQPEDFLVPRNVSIWSMLAFYIGFLSCIIPYAGFFLGIAVIGFAVTALCRRRRNTSYGEVSSDLRGVFGLLFGIASTLIWGLLLVQKFAK